MSRIKSAFADGKAFIGFITCGDPDLETTAAAVRAAVKNGADLIELGIPFSEKKDALTPEQEALFNARKDARKAKNWAESDRIRDELKAQGILVEDTPQGMKWKRI